MKIHKHFGSSPCKQSSSQEFSQVFSHIVFDPSVCHLVRRALCSTIAMAEVPRVSSSRLRSLRATRTKQRMWLEKTALNGQWMPPLFFSYPGWQLEPEGGLHDADGHREYVIMKKNNNI